MSGKLIFSVLFAVCMACSKPSTPTPATTTANSNTSTPVATVIVKQQINNTYTLLASNSSNQTTTSYATEAAEETITTNGNYIYALVAADGSGNSLQFWFAQKPSAGTYSVSNSTTSVPSGSTVLALTLNGTDYFSMGQGSISITINNSGNYVITANNILLMNVVATAAESVSTTLTIP